MNAIDVFENNSTTGAGSPSRDPLQPLLNLIASSIESGAAWLFLSEGDQTDVTFRAGLPETPPDDLAECVNRSLRLDDSSPSFLSHRNQSPSELSAALCIALHHMDGSRLGVL
ncbi:MAG: hypothetical protein JNM70_15470, partial [Anaerolineae bacterium]|nr:hypothetical protein [Anaerolineae bacterium]